MAGKKWIKWFLMTLVLPALSLISFYSSGQDVIGPSGVISGTFLGETPPLRDLPVITEEEWDLMVEKSKRKMLNPKIRYRSYLNAHKALPTGPDEAWQRTMGTRIDGNRAPLQNINGSDVIGYPSDANGTIGPNHYMQTINVVYTIFNRAGVVVAGPTNMNLLFYGVAGSNTNDGDPIVLYDEQADRWLAAEFSISGANDYMLIAVSTTNDPTGTWYKYSFDVPDVPDYEKFGIWQDGYYMGTNTNGNADVYIFNRDQMLAGQTPSGIAFDNPWRPGPATTFNCVPPVDNDGTFAPAGEPGIFIALNDDAVGGGTDQLWIIELDADWATPANSTLTRTQQIDVTAFDSNFGTDWSNIKQQGTTMELDAIPQMLMNPPQYRNFGSYETIVCCHTVDVDNTDHAGIRWYEMRRTAGGDWTIRQQGTYAPDSHSRWMGSIMLNGANEIALGYSISSSTLYPGIRYSGQSSTAYAAGNSTLDVAEDIIHTGAYSQTNYNRWGDYASMQVDVSDDETFWFTSQYSGASNAVKTKIASFQIGTVLLTSNFAVSNPRPQQYSTVTFTDVSFGSPTSWNWTITPSTFHFISGTNNQSQHPIVQFNEPGFYTVSLTVSNGTVNDTETKTGFIEVLDCGYLYLPVNVDFADSTLPDCWRNIDNIGLGQIWVFDNPNNRPVATPTAGNGFALVDSYGYGPGYTQNADLITPLLDLSAYTTVNLSFYHWFYYQTPSTGRLYYSINDGATWTQITSWASTTANPANYSQNVSSFVAGKSRVRFRWNYSATYGIIWAIDDISITGTGPVTWTGSTSSDWATGSNWSTGTVPTSTSNVIIPISAVNWPTVTGDLNMASLCDTLTLYGAAQLTVNGNVILPSGKAIVFNGNGTLSLTGNWINGGGNFIPGNGTVTFTGSTPSKIIPPTTSTTNIVNYQRSTFPAGMTNLVSPTTGPTGNNTATNVSIGFTFNYLGTNYTTLRLCTNGWVTLNVSGSTSSTNSTLFNSTAPNTTLAPWFDDISDDATSVVSYKTEGTSPYRVFTAEWKSVLTFSAGATERISFQVKLFETTNIIEFHYGSKAEGTNNASESASIGIEDATGGSAHFIEATTGSTTTGISNLTATNNWPTVNYRFSPPPASQTFQNITVNKTGSYLDILANNSINGSLNVTAGTASGPTTNGGVLQVKGNWINNGSYIPGGNTVVFNGTSVQSIEGTTPTAFNNMTVNNASGVTFQNSQTVRGTLTMISGNIICDSYTLELGTSATSTGTLTYTSGNITGSFRRWVAASTATPVDFPVGTATSGHKARITFTNNTAGSLTAKFEPGNPGNNTGFPLTDGTETINESDQYTEGSWTLVPSGLTSSNYALELDGTGFTTAGDPDATMRIMKRPDGGGNWTFDGTHVAGSPPTAKRSGLSGFSRFALAKPGSLRKILGNITYYNATNTPLLTGVTVKLYQDGSQVGSDFTVTNGTYEFAGLAAGTYELRVSSTIPTEGSINTTDAAQTNYWGAIPYQIEKVRFYAGDVTGSGYYINSTDALKIQQHFVNGTSFDKGSWAFWRAGETISSNSNPTESYPVVNLGTSNITANIYGLCAGDFNRSFTPGASRDISSCPVLENSGSREARAGEEVALALRSEDALTIGAVSLILHVPSGLVEVVDIKAVQDEGHLAWSLKEDELRISWQSITPMVLEKGGELMTLLLKPKEGFVPGSEIRLTLEPDPLNELADGIGRTIPSPVLEIESLEAVSLYLGEKEEADSLCVNITPNPAADHTLLSYNLPSAGRVIIEISNMPGNINQVMLDETQQQGKNSVSLNVKDFPAGIYNVTIRFNAGPGSISSTIKLLVKN